MKKIILLALIASSAVFAIEASDMVKDAAVAEATSEVKVAAEEVVAEAVASESNASEEAPAEKPAM